MEFVSTTSMRKNISEIIDKVKYKDQIIGIGRRNRVDAVLIKYPENLNKDLNDITNINANSSSFNFLEKEPDLYGVNDLKKRYV